MLLPVRRGLMFQAPTATSRVQAKNAIITKGIEVMSLMVNVHDSVHAEKASTSKVSFYFFCATIVPKDNGVDQGNGTIRGASLQNMSSFFATFWRPLAFLTIDILSSRHSRRKEESVLRGISGVQRVDRPSVSPLHEICHDDFAHTTVPWFVPFSRNCLELSPTVRQQH